MKRGKSASSCILHLRTLLPKTSIATVRAAWLLVIFWYEIGTYHWSLAGCRWPDAELTVVDEKASSSSTDVVSPIHVLLIADSQVRAPRRHPVWRRWLHLTDLSLRKRWSFVRRYKPDVVISLGDMLDNGRYLDDEEYRETFEYFESLFHCDQNATVYYVPGNHDVGLGPSTRMATARALRRYLKHFGPLNNKISIANHTLVMLDAPGLVDEDYRRAAAATSFEDWKALPDGTIEFINNFAGVGSEEPVILFSHIPLFRPDTAGCGPLRERGAIRRGVGPGFQNMLMRDTTNYILRFVRPAVVFSGNDHDYCEYTHSIPLLSEGPEPKIDRVREVTVKAISNAGGIHRPGFQLLSLAPTLSLPSSKTFADIPCFFPDEQNTYYWRYIPLLVLSLVVLFVPIFRRHCMKHHHLDNSQRQSMEETGPDEGSADLLPLSVSPSAHDKPSGQNSETASLLSTARSQGNSSLAPPTLRATDQHTSHTPDFTVDGSPPNYLQASVTPSSPSPSPSSNRLALHHGRHHSLSEAEALENDEANFQTPGQFARYRLRSEKGDDHFRLTLDRARRRRQLAWTWAFELGGRRRRLVVGVPFLLEHVARTLWNSLVGVVANSRRSNTVHETILQSFLRSILDVAWPSVLLILMIDFFLIR